MSNDIIMAYAMLMEAEDKRRKELLGIPESRMGKPGPRNLSFPLIVQGTAIPYVNSPEYARLIQKEREIFLNQNK